MGDLRTGCTREIIELLHREYGGKLRIFGSIIPLSIRAAESSAGKIRLSSSERSDDRERAQEVPLVELFAFKSHPFHVTDDVSTPI